MIPLLALLLSAFPVTKDYHFLAGPDGQIPLPEVRDTDTCLVQRGWFKVFGRVTFKHGQATVDYLSAAIGGTT